MQGILIVNKPKGMTSHDVVSYIRRQFGTRQVGHTGTLDPDAEGVLPILVGRATKLSELLAADEKSYAARVQLGVATDTYDSSGSVAQERPVSVTEEEIRETLKAFLGVQLQIPPMYSAIKLGGKKLYQLARQGVEVERPAREIEIRKLECLDFDLENHRFSLQIDCSKGTYIRSLCHDLGQRLGCGACMAGLVRTRSGRFTLGEAHSLAEIAGLSEQGKAESLLIPPDEALADYPALRVSEENAGKIRNGLRLRTQQLGIPHAAEGDWFRIYDAKGLLCLGSVFCDEPGTPVMKLEKTFFN